MRVFALRMRVLALKMGVLPPSVRVFAPTRRVLPPTMRVSPPTKRVLWTIMKFCADNDGACTGNEAVALTSREVVADHEVWTPTMRVLASTEGCCRR
jgi:hypothetical protein